MSFDKEQVKDAMDELINLITKALQNKLHPSIEEIEDVFQNNIELIRNKIQLNDDELKFIIKKIQEFHPINNKVSFDNAIKQFEEIHLSRLKTEEEKREKIAEEQQKEEEARRDAIDSGGSGGAFLRGVGKGVSEVGKGVGKGVSEVGKGASTIYDDLKKKFEAVYYYVWWLLDNQNSYQELLNNSHSYPRNRGSLKVYYQEIGTKDMSDALKGNKSKGKVEGEFLGALGLTGKNTEFTDPQPGFRIPNVLPLKEGQIIVLGVARARRINFREGIIQGIRGLTKKGLMRFDVERLLWKWNKWTNENKPEGEGEPSQEATKEKKKESEEAEKDEIKELKYLNKEHTSLTWEEIKKVEKLIDDIRKEHNWFKNQIKRLSEKERNYYWNNILVPLFINIIGIIYGKKKHDRSILDDIKETLSTNKTFTSKEINLIIEESRNNTITLIDKAKHEEQDELLNEFSKKAEQYLITLIKFYRGLNNPKE